MNPSDLILALFNARTAAHVAHLQTTSYAAHKALQGFYKGIIGLADAFAEAWIGCKGPIRFGGSTIKLSNDPVAMLTSLRENVVRAREACGETHLQNILDEILALIDSTRYLLTLK
jgi:hypothetical protein